MAQAEDFVRFDETINRIFKTIINKTLRRGAAACIRVCGSRLVV